MGQLKLHYVKYRHCCSEFTLAHANMTVVMSFIATHLIASQLSSIFDVWCNLADFFSFNATFAASYDKSARSFAIERHQQAAQLPVAAP
ncbi:hypothetical protein M1E08_08680 [Erwinia sp. PK3-005]